METKKIKAIVIGNNDYKEKDKLVTLFSLEDGIVTVCFKGVKSNNAKLKSAKELFTFGDFIYIDGKQKTATGADVISYFYDITKKLPNFYTACNIIDIIKTVMPKSESNPYIFVDFLKCLNLLNESKVDNVLILNKFLIRIFELFGYKFNLNICNSCGAKFINKRFMNLKYGDITCYSCRVGEVIEISNAEFNALRLISLTDYDKISTLKFPESIIKSVFNVLNKNYAYRFNKTINL